MLEEDLSRAEFGDLSISQSEFVGAELRTRLGSAFFYADDERFRAAARDVPNYEGEYVIDVHGTPTSNRLYDIDENLQELNAHDFAEVIRQSTGWSGEPIRLFSCYTGRDSKGFAQQLADALEVPVTAPTAPVGTSEGSGGSVPEKIGETMWVVDESNGAWKKTFVLGSWQTFLPRHK